MAGCWIPWQSSMSFRPLVVVSTLLFFLFLITQMSRSAAFDAKFRDCQALQFCQQTRRFSHARLSPSTTTPISQSADKLPPWRIKSSDHVRGSDTLRLWLEGPSNLVATIQACKPCIFRLIIDEAKADGTPSTRYRIPQNDVLEDLPPAKLVLSPSDQTSESAVTHYLLQTIDGQADPEYQLTVQSNPFMIRISSLKDKAVIFSINSHQLLTLGPITNFGSQQKQSSKKPAMLVEDKTMHPLDNAREYDVVSSSDNSDDATIQEQLADQSPIGANVNSPSSNRFDKVHANNNEEFIGKETSAVSLDIVFPEASVLYGIPLHASSLALKSTRSMDPTKPAAYTDPYRLFNLDRPIYPLDVPSALYGAIPFMIGHSEKRSDAVYWNNPSDTFIDVYEPTTSGGGSSNVDAGDGSSTPLSKSRLTHWFSEAGIVDLFLIPGPAMTAVLERFAQVTGKPYFPPLFSLAYHQCRWSYRDQEDVLQVDHQFDELSIPYDVIWLDIDYTKDKRYFTWDYGKFPDPIRMQQELVSHGRELVTIIDPHVKADPDYFVFKELLEAGYGVKNNNGEIFRGDCWPGESVWPDFSAPKVRAWWAQLYSLERFAGSTPHLHIWNDMNEPSVFKGPETTFPKENLHEGNIEHCNLHNLYGQYFHRSTFEGLTRRNGNRPFTLSRSFFAGTQKYGFIWTGDNGAQWSYLQIAAPMLLSLGIAAMPYVGADVGGFGGDPSPELLVRWYQAGALQPFFRGHSSQDTKRREPWVFGDPYTTHIRDAIRLRYALLPYLYTTIYGDSTKRAIPLMRPMVLEYPRDARTFTIDDQYFVGPHLVHKPVVHERAESVDLYLPHEDNWFSYFDLRLVVPEENTSMLRTAVTLGSIPLFIRGGAIIPRKDIVRRSSKSMAFDPYTLIVVPNKQINASGSLYVDDGTTMEYKSGMFVETDFRLEGNTLSCIPKSAAAEAVQKLSGRTELNTVYFASIGTRPKVVALDVPSKQTSMMEFEHDGEKQSLVVKLPNVRITEPWTLKIAYY